MQYIAHGLSRYTRTPLARSSLRSSVCVALEASQALVAAADASRSVGYIRLGPHPDTLTLVTSLTDRSSKQRSKLLHGRRHQWYQVAHRPHSALSPRLAGNDAPAGPQQSRPSTARVHSLQRASARLSISAHLPAASAAAAPPVPTPPAAPQPPTMPMPDPPAPVVAPVLPHPVPNHPPAPDNLRVCSLLPSATETVGRLGLAQHLVCVTHCCDIAPDSKTLDELLSTGAAVRATSSFVMPNTMSQHDIDEMVKGTFAAGKPLYGINSAALAAQRPSVVITQGLCDVCAPTEAQAESALANAGTAMDSGAVALREAPANLQRLMTNQVRAVRRLPLCCLRLKLSGGCS